MSVCFQRIPKSSSWMQMALRIVRGSQVERARGRIASVQLCDWMVPLPADALLGRGHLGDGVIDFGPLVAAVLSAGYPGFVEIEIFNQEVWDAPADETAATVRQRFARLPD